MRFWSATSTWNHFVTGHRFSTQRLAKDPTNVCRITRRLPNFAAPLEVPCFGEQLCLTTRLESFVCSYTGQQPGCHSYFAGCSLSEKESKVWNRAVTVRFFRPSKWFCHWNCSFFEDISDMSRSFARAIWGVRFFDSHSWPFHSNMFDHHIYFYSSYMLGQSCGTICGINVYLIKVYYMFYILHTVCIFAYSLQITIYRIIWLVCETLGWNRGISHEVPVVEKHDTTTSFRRAETIKTLCRLGWCRYFPHQEEAPSLSRRLWASDWEWSKKAQKMKRKRAFRKQTHKEKTKNV